jgi:FMN phosphatase YigB (HAD superfamily)
MAAREIGVDPAKCAYLGDNPLRDIQGTREAGYGMMILIEEPDTLRKMPEDVVINPDRIITRIDELLDIFPPRNQDA